MAEELNMNTHARGRPLRYTYAEDFVIGWIRRSLSRDPRKPRGQRLLFDCVFMMIFLTFYFSGGYLFVTAYNKEFPIFNYGISATLATVLMWVGPILFFIGLIGFVIFYATLCNDISND